jgi:hypothetical protein
VVREAELYADSVKGIDRYFFPKQPDILCWNLVFFEEARGHEFTRVAYCTNMVGKLHYVGVNYVRSSEFVLKLFHTIYL